MIQDIWKMLNQYAVDIPSLPVNLCLSHLVQRVNSVFLISQKNEIVRFVRRPKLQRLRAEDAIVELYLVLKTLVTW